jgi:hypothetical protein
LFDDRRVLAAHQSLPASSRAGGVSGLLNAARPQGVQYSRRWAHPRQAPLSCSDNVPGPTPSSATGRDQLGPARLRGVDPHGQARDLDRLNRDRPAIPGVAIHSRSFLGSSASPPGENAPQPTAGGAVLVSRPAGEGGRTMRRIRWLAALGLAVTLVCGSAAPVAAASPRAGEAWWSPPTRPSSPSSTAAWPSTSSAPRIRVSPHISRASVAKRRRCL